MISMLAATDLGALSAQLARLASESALQAEADRRVGTDLVDLIRRSGLAVAAAPQSVGGSDLGPAQLLDVIRTVATADGSAGWVTMIYLTSSIGAHWISDPGLEEIYRRPGTLLAGVVAPKGLATPTSSGFRLSGRWAFGSGAADADWVGLGAMIDGEGRTGLFYLPRSTVDVIDTWDVLGLRGSASHDLAVSNAEVPTHLVSFLDQPARTNESVAHYPFLGQLAAGIGAVGIGIAEAALAEAIELAAGKTPTGSQRRLADRAAVQEAISRGQAEVESAWLYLTHRATDVTGVATIEDRVRLRMAATRAVETSREVVDRMYAICGGTSLYARSPLQRYLRDIHTAAQHMMVSQPTWELTGRVLLGIDVDPPGL